MSDFIRDSVMPHACLHGSHEAIYDNVASHASRDRLTWSSPKFREIKNTCKERLFFEGEQFLINKRVYLHISNIMFYQYFIISYLW